MLLISVAKESVTWLIITGICGNSLCILTFLKQEAKAEELIDKAPTLKDKAEVLSEEMPKPSPEPAVSAEQAMVRLAQYWYIMMMLHLSNSFIFIDLCFPLHPLFEVPRARGA